MSKSLRAIQISLDFIIRNEANGNELAERVCDILNTYLDIAICVGADCCSDDMTGYYREIINEMES